MAATAESDGIDVKKLWKEIKDWKEHWKLSRFFYVLILGLAVSVFDSGTDFIFAWSVPEACGQNTPECGKHHFDLASICGIFHYKNIERSAFTFIALPGFFLGFSGLQSLVSASIKKCWRGEVHRCVRGSAGVFAVALEGFLVVGLLLAARGQKNWSCHLPRLAELYDLSLHGMAYLSASVIIGVKCLGTFCHGPECCRLLFRTKQAETKFEAALQLGLLLNIYLSSGHRTWESLLSATSSIIAIGVNGVQNFLQRHQEKIDEASLLGKICVAASVLPAFLLTTAFKLGMWAEIRVWDAKVMVILLLLGLGLPNLVVLLLKMNNHLKDLPMANVNQSVFSDILTLHLWPKTLTGKKIGLAMTFFTFLLIAALGPFIIANPEPTISENYWVIESNSTAEWTQDTGDRLQAASLYFLTIGSVAFILAICLILNEDRWVAKIVSNFPNCSKPDPVWFRGRPRH